MLFAALRAAPRGKHRRKEDEMAKFCEICGKGPKSGNRISHAHNRSAMRQLPNLQTVHVKRGGRSKSMRVCTKCIKSGRIEKGA